MLQLVELREIMRRWPSGVAILTAGDGDQKQGLTVNSFASVAVAPPMITVTLDHASKTKRIVDQRGYFAINLLAEGQEEISERFAGRSGNQEDRFSGLDLFYSENGTPMLSLAAACLDCRTVHVFETTTSTLYVAEVLLARKGQDLPPLVYFNRSYHRITK